MNLSTHEKRTTTGKSHHNHKIFPAFKTFNAHTPTATPNLSNGIKVTLDLKAEDSCLPMGNQVDRMHIPHQNNFDTYSILLSNSSLSSETLEKDNFQSDIHGQIGNGVITELSLTDVELIVQEWKIRQGVSGRNPLFKLHFIAIQSNIFIKFIWQSDISRTKCK